jgi:hypothetical protein
MIQNLSNDWWTQTLGAASIDAAYRQRIEKRLQQRLQREGDVDLLSLSAARRDIRRLIAATNKAAGALSRLEKNHEFMRHNRIMPSDELDERFGGFRAYRPQFFASLTGFLAEKDRLSARSAKGVEDKDRARLLVDLLEIWAEARGVSVPYQASETAMTGKYVEFLKRCLRATERHLGEAELQEKLRTSLNLAIRGFCSRRTWERARRNQGQHLSRSARRPRTAARHHAQSSTRRSWSP